MYPLRHSERMKLKGVHWILVDIFHEAREHQDVRVGLHGGIRSNEIQGRLFKNKKTNIKKNGPHQKGFALDIVRKDLTTKEGWNNEKEWKKFARFIEKCAVRIGVWDYVFNLGLEYGWDYPHWQLKDNFKDLMKKIEG